MDAAPATAQPSRTGARAPFRIAGTVTVALVLATCSRPPDVLTQIRESGLLQVATRNSPTAYYLGLEGPEGPEYELAHGFAEWLGVKAGFVVVPSGSAALEEVARHRVHLAAAGIVANPTRRSRLVFGPAYQQVSQHIVYRAWDPPPESAADLDGKRIEVVAGSTHAEALAALARHQPGLTFVERRGVDQLDLLARVSSGDIDYTVADSSEFSLGRHLHPELRTAFTLTLSEGIAWATSPRDDSLAPLVRRYFDDIQADGSLERVLARYYEAADRFDYVHSLNFVRHIHERLPELRPIFEQAAAETGFDWRLLAAIAYQESKWDPAATSATGVRGIMMLTEPTAARVGIDDRLDPVQSILGGARYLIEVENKIPPRIPEPDRMWLALAAYNVGFGHLEDARILTQRQGGSPDRWADVRRHLPLLAQERWYATLRRGYARGWEPVQFVDRIEGYLEMLVWLTGSPDAPLRLVTPPPVDVMADTAAVD